MTVGVFLLYVVVSTADEPHCQCIREDHSAQLMGFSGFMGMQEE